MSDHTHSQYVEGCFRCDLSRDEVASGYITEEMVEVAAKTRWDYARAESGDITEWDMRYPSFREFDTDAMRAALEAVAPLIAAKAWDEGHAEGSRGRMWDSINPYQSSDRIEQGGQP